MQDESLQKLLAERFGAAVAQVAGTKPEQTDPMLRVAGEPRFGDYQCNVAMSLAKPLRAKPREVAERIVAAAQPLLAEIAEPLEIAGPGFINVRLKAEFLAQYLGEIPRPPSEPEADARGTGDPGAATAGADDATAGTPRYRSGLGSGPSLPLGLGFVDRVGLPPVESPQRVVVEYSQPNIAKQMHVGHLRSTIIGDVFARVLAFQGHEVIRQNHIGDWGTQFGMLIRWYREHPLPTPETHVDVLDAIEDDYKAANERFKTDAAFATEARLAVGQLQAGDPAARQVWEQICAVSRQAFTEIYERLGVLLRPEDVRGESFYNDRLPGIVADLRQALAPRSPLPLRGGGGSAAPRAEVREDQGAVVVYLYDEDGQPPFKNPDGEILGMIVQKSDGAYLYATTDLAALRFRLHELPFPSGVGAERVIYVTDARQKLHFQMFLAAARAVGWVLPAAQIDHVTFGSVLGEDRKPLKTRAGGTIKLCELLEEAERRAFELLQQRETQPPAPEAEWQTGGGTAPPNAVATAGGELQPRPRVLRLHALAKELGVSSTEIIEKCRAEGIDLSNHMAVISASLAESIREWFHAGSGPSAELVEQLEIARRVGIAAVKYADLRNDRNADYVFSWDKMLALNGNTAPYMMYAYARIRSIYRKAAERFGSPDVYAPGVRLALADPAERTLALRLARLRETLDVVAADLLPHVLCTYLYDLAGEFMRFYETCPVLRAADEATRLSRMRLCDLTARTLKLGLGLLGIETLERM